MSDNKNDNLEHKLEALGKGVELRDDFTKSVMTRVRKCPTPKAAGTNRFRRLIMNKPILKWLPTATAAAVLIILLMVLPSSNSGIVLADVLQKFNLSKIIKINAVQNKENGEKINAQFWLDVDRQIIITQQSDDTAALIDINSKMLSLFKDNEKIQSMPMTDEYLKIYRFDGDMLGWMLRILGKEFPELDVSIESWDKESDDDKHVVFVHELDTNSYRGEFKLSVDKQSEKLNSFEAVLTHAGKSEQVILMEFEYPDAFPEIYEKQAEMEIVEEQLEKLDNEKELQQSQKPTGTLLAEVIAKLNGTKIIKMVNELDMGGMQGMQKVNASYWFDVNNQIVVLDASNGMVAVVNLRTKEQKAFIDGQRQATTTLADEMVEVMSFDGDMLALIMKILAKTMPGVDRNVENWQVKNKDEVQTVLYSQVDGKNIKGEVRLIIDNADERLVGFEADLDIEAGDASAHQSIKSRFEYPDTMPKVALNEIEINQVSQKVEKFDKDSSEDNASEEFRLFSAFFDDIIDAMRQITCYKSLTKKYLPGKEGPVSEVIGWTDFERKESYSVWSGKYIHHLDDKDHSHKIYVPETNSLKIDYIEYDHLKDAESCELMLDEFVKKQGEEGIEISRRSDIIDGKDVEIVELAEKLNDIGIEGKKITKMLMNGQYVKYDKRLLIVDAETSLVISTERYLYNHDNELLRKSVTEFVYDTGFPKDMHELGMPDDVTVVNNMPSVNIQEIRKEVLDHKKSFIDKYIAVITESSVEDDGSERIIEAMVVNSHGKHLRVDVYRGTYGNPDEITPKYEGRLKNSLDILKEFCSDRKQLQIRSVRFYDGLWQQNFDAKNDVLVAKEKQRRPDGDEYGDDDIADFGWKNLWHHQDREHEYKDEFSLENKLIALEMTSESEFKFYLPKRQLLYVDPAKGYLMKRYVSQELLDADWTKDDKWKETIDMDRVEDEVMTTEVVEYGQTSCGKWYPKEMTIKGWNKPCSKNSVKIDRKRIVRIYLIEESQGFDEELFKPWDNAEPKVEKAADDDQASEGFRLFGFIFDDMIAAMKRQPWLYQYMDNGSNVSQWWICPEEKISIHDYNSDVTYRDYKKNEILQYYKERNEIEQSMLTPSGMDVDFDDKEQMDQAFNRPYQELERLRKQIEYEKTEPEVSEGQYRGHEVRIFKYRSNDEKLNLGDDGCWLIMYLDAEQDLLRGYIQWCHLSVGPEPKTAQYIGVEKIEQAYDYPEPGPQSIYDVGVPKDAKYLDRVDEEFIKFLDTYKSYKEKGLNRIACIITNYDTEMGDMVTWVESRNNPDGPISKLTEPLGDIAEMFDVYYVDGQKYRQEHRFNIMDQLGSKNLIQYWPKCRQELGYTYDSQLNWIRAREDETFSSIEIFDGKYQYHLAEYDKWKYSKTAKELYDPMIDKGKLEERTWPDINIKAEITEDDYSKEHNLLCIRYEQKTPWQEGVDVFTYYLNPEKDYLCHKQMIEWAGGSTQVHEIEEYQQINGKWYPKNVKYGSLEQDKKEIEYRNRSVFFIDDSPDFGYDVFDGGYVELLYEKYKNEE